jgi:hypothetical protein
VDAEKTAKEHILLIEVRGVLEVSVNDVRHADALVAQWLKAARENPVPDTRVRWLKKYPDEEVA